jgi:hypothetical protein
MTTKTYKLDATLLDRDRKEQAKSRVEFIQSTGLTEWQGGALTSRDQAARGLVFIKQAKAVFNDYVTKCKELADTVGPLEYGGQQWQNCPYEKKKPVPGKIGDLIEILVDYGIDGEVISVVKEAVEHYQMKKRRIYDCYKWGK